MRMKDKEGIFCLLTFLFCLFFSAKFYRAESQNYIANNTVSDYMRKVEQRMREESERVAVYLDVQTDSKIKVREREKKRIFTWHCFSKTSFRSSFFIFSGSS